MLRGTGAALTIISIGLLTFGAVFSLLEFSPSSAAAGQSGSPPPPLPTPTPALVVSADSLAPTIAAGSVAVGVPTAGSDALLRDVVPGDRVDILASLTLPGTAQPLTTVLVRGAAILRPASNGDPLLVQVSAADAVMLAHLVMGGTHLAYIVWPAGVASVQATPPAVDERSVREALGISSTAPIVPQAPSPTPFQPVIAMGQGTPGPRTDSGFLYQVQPGDTWDSIAAIFGLPTSQIRQWNEAAGAADPAPGALVFIPRGS